METIIKKLKAIIESNSVTAEDKQFIADMSIQYQLEFSPKGRCKNCYIDQAVIIYNAISKDKEPSCSSVLRDDIDVVIDGHRINNATLTDELVEKYKGKGLPLHWFV